MRQTGGALGVAVLGSIASTRYNRSIDRLRLAPTVARNAKQSLATALQAAARHPDATAQRLFDVARAGFTDGIKLATFVAACTALAAAYLVVRFLPAREDANNMQQPNELQTGEV
jgi:hypothetical protein